MIISHKYKFIFVKTEKTAGTSIEVYLSQFCGQGDILTPFGRPERGHEPRNYHGYYNHIDAKTIRAMVPQEVWNNYYKFCVERNPWDKTLSHYHFVNNRFEKGQMSLDQYIQRGQFCINYPKYTDGVRVIIDRVAKYENLASELSEIFALLGVPFDGSLNVHAKNQYRKDRRPYQQVFDRRQREIIATAFEREIQLHGYTFD